MLMFTVVTTISLIAGVLLLTYRLWYLVTWVMTLVQVLHLHVIHATGAEGSLWANILINAQGEDVVAGVRTPHANRSDGRKTSQKRYAAVHNRFAMTLENHYRDMQDMEFTVENKKLYMLTDT